VDARPGGDAVQPAEPSAGTTRRNPWNLVLAAACALVLVGAGVVLLTARSTAASTSDLDAATATLQQRHDDGRNQADRDDQRRQDLADAGNDLTQALDALDPAVVALDDATRTLVTTDNEALDDFGNGHDATARGVLDSRGVPQLADLVNRTKAVQDAIADIQGKAARLKELLDG